MIATCFTKLAFMRRKMATLLVCIVAAVWAASAAQAPAQEPSAEAAEDSLPPILELALRPWTGTFDEMAERKIIRIAIPVSLATYFVDGARQAGPTYELAVAYEKYLRDTLGKPARDLTVVVIPSRRDRVLDMVVDGQADIAAGIVTVTEERAERLDFSPPLLSDVDEVIVTGKGTAAARSLDELAGLDIHVRRSTSFWGTLEQLNAERVARGAAPFAVVPADEQLRTEDLLELVATGIIPATVADGPVATLLAAYFTELTIHRDVPLAQGRSYAWAFRKGDSRMAEMLAGFAATARKGTYLGNVILAKYTKNTDWIEDVRVPDEQEKLREMAELFRAYADQYDFDWLMVAAQGYQESHLDQSKRSPVGAVGVMQVMPATAKDPAVGIPNIENVDSNIHAGVRYLHLLRTTYLKDPALSDLDRTLLSFAAYNAGPGNLNKARKRAEKLGLDRNVWFDNVEIAMGQAVSREPVIYVRNIFKYYTAFKLLAAERAGRKPAE